MGRQKSKYTMKDVARLAGVSNATVSAVINGTATVSPDRTLRVKQAIEAIDYHPDQVARSLKVGRTFVIGMMIPDVTNTFFPAVIRGVEDAARVEGYSVILCNSNEDADQEQCHLNMLLSRRVDGVLLAYVDNAPPYDRLLRRRLPIVFFDRVPQGPHRGAVATDNVAACHLATRHLIELGHQEIAFIAGNLRLSPHADRLAGFRSAMQRCDLPIRDRFLKLGDLSIETGYRIGLELLRLDDPPTAVISSNSKMLLGLLRAIRELGYSCPERVSVIGFDDHVWSEFFNPPLTTVAQPCYEMGKMAFEMLLKRIHGEATEKGPSGELVLLDAELHLRQSTAPPPKSAMTPLIVSGSL
jgi:LacI family transcriptional regulator